MGDLKSELGKKLGFGCMRLPLTGEDAEQIDEAAFCRMADRFLEQGFTYFDTAYPYHNQKSEEAVRRCVVERYPREKFLLADKMPVWMIGKPEDLETTFQTQLARCGVDYFDFYLLHALGRERIRDAEEKGCFSFIQKMKEEGKIRHIGCSFHDSADVLEKLLDDHPELEFVQLQINYYDWESDSVQSRKCYETAERHGVPVIVMEPVKGGTLANMIGKPAEILSDLDADASYASFAIRFAASLENVMMVLSGMSDEAQMEDNLSYMKDFVPLAPKEEAAAARVVAELEKMPVIPCTVCRYCVEGCPKKIPIPDLFSDYNGTVRFGMTQKARDNYAKHTESAGAAKDCIRCGKCETQCPQHLHIRDLLSEVADTFQ